MLKRNKTSAIVLLAEKSINDLLKTECLLKFAISIILVLLGRIAVQRMYSVSKKRPL